ncbi:SET and MYND domain-containing protein 4 isoform X1 [Apis mellifera]|uniref:Protein-lysine N-methyltransferase SMYD4 n=1 Tax=Apis mellifera TaxID=7460 RepID=A0A7M7LIG8_APIME|nr:SET and MYND domain-containing protein 4 isoform X1 [Apis mellifera]|eukprot:XP_001122116.2 SET and MYND domain-containing protein 4 isoform X1 [Apis mellifera]
MEKVLDALNAKIIAANKHQDLFLKYKTLHTDEDRIMFTLNVMLEYNIIPQVCDNKKDAKESEKLREQGNKIFISTPLKNYTCVEALKLYTKSIAYAPYPSEQLALAYANRSAVLIKLHKYKLCIQDIDRTLALAYPNNLRAKLYVRKVECLNALKNPNVEDTIKEAQYWLEKVSLDNRKKLNEKLKSIKNMLPSQKFKKEKFMKQAPLPKIKTHNIEVPCASDAITIKYNDKYGRHIVATRKINPGEVIAIEKPYSLILTPDNIYTHCSNCLEVSWANIPCEYCTYAMYCSEECKAMEWKKYHDIECAIFPSMLKMNFVKLDLFSLRLAIQAVREATSIQELRKELEEVDSCEDPRTKGFSKNGMFLSDKYRSLLGLITNTEKRSVQDLFRRSLDASFILYFLATCSNMFGNPLKKDLSVLIKNDNVIFVGGLILRHQQLIPSNIHSFSEECGLDAVERGIAAMPFFSLINHSCNPNILRHSRSNYMIIYVIYPIKKGEQLYDNYGQHYAITPKEERQKELLKQYYFKCNCLACQEDWPLYYNLKSFKSLIKKKEDESKINHVLRKFNNYVDIATEGNISDKHIVDDLLKMIEVLYDLVPMPCAEMNNVVETLKRVYDLNGNRFEIPDL